MSRPIETWLETIAAFVCFAGLLAVIYACVMVFGPEMMR